MSNTVKLYMNHDTPPCKVVMGETIYKKSIFSSSALQLPDMQKTRLAELLRKNLRKQLSRSKQRAQWKNFITACQLNSANSNTQHGV